MLLYVGVNSTPYDTVFIDETTDAAGSFRPRRSPGSPTSEKMKMSSDVKYVKYVRCERYCNFGARSLRVAS